MTKRFCDTELWQKEWFQLLSIKEKIIVKYIFENCDCAGIWEINLRMASFVIGEVITLNDIKTINSKKKLFDFIDDKYIFIVNFCNFQYGKLSENCRPHIPIIEKLKKMNLLERVFKGYLKGSNATLEEKEKEKEKDNISSLVLSSLNENEQKNENEEKEKEIVSAPISVIDENETCKKHEYNIIQMLKAQERERLRGIRDG